MSTTTTANSTSSSIYAAVTSHYSAASRTANASYSSTVARAFGYTDSELASIPTDSNLGLSCGNPLVLAALKPGETVLDLGSGAGFDAFLAAPRVGEHGHVIGVDMNRDMLAKAERNRAAANGGKGANNVKFVEAAITKIAPVESGSVDCIISNCVVNLVPEEEKHLVFREMFRLLKPGGRVAISDILIKDGEGLPETLKRDMGLYVGCIAGASFVSGYERYLKEAGFGEVLIVDNGKDLNVYNSAGDGDGEAKTCCGTSVPVQQAKSCCGTSVPVKEEPKKSCCGTTAQVSESSCSGKQEKETNGGDVGAVGVDLTKVDFNAYAGSFNIYAVKA